MNSKCKKWVIAFCIIILLLAIISNFWIRPRVQQYLCSVNLCSLVSCLHVYMNDYESRYPTPNQWCDLLKDEAKAPIDTFKCPGAKIGPCTYALNKNVYSYKNSADVPDDLVFMFESKPGWNQAGGIELLTTEYHQGRGCYIMFANLTGAFVKKEDLSSLRWE